MSAATTSRPTLTLVRHGETPWSASGQHTGRTDLELTVNGELQAAAVRPLVAGSYDMVLCSPLRRACRTAELAGLTPYQVDDDLQEWDYGELDGLTTAQIQQSIPGWSVWSGPWPGGESAAEVGLRADAVIARALTVGSGAAGAEGGAGTGRSVRVALVAHGHFLRVLAARWLGLDVNGGRLLRLDTATVSELGWEHDNRVVDRWNQPAPR